MKIYFAVQTHNFQRRLCWQLSSIYEQEPFDAELEIDIACLPDNGDPSTEYVCAFFQNRGLDVQLSYHDKETFAKRGLVRNWQIKDAADRGADWMFFADCDNVYSPDFFRLLVDRLRTDCADVDSCIYSKSKDHTETEATEQHARLTRWSPWIPAAYLRAQKIPTIRKGNKPVAAGCMQVVRMDAIMDAGGLYVEPERCGDRHLFKKGQRARSDKQFRSRMGGSYHIALPKQIHLGHHRDKEEGYHLEVQR